MLAPLGNRDLGYKLMFGARDQTCAFARPMTRPGDVDPGFRRRVTRPSRSRDIGAAKSDRIPLAHAIRCCVIGYLGEKLRAGNF
jgi:hypothetical protein